MFEIKLKDGLFGDAEGDMAILNVMFKAGKAGIMLYYNALDNTLWRHGNGYGDFISMLCRKEGIV